MEFITWGAAQWSAFGQVGALLVAIIAGILVWLQVRQGRQLGEDQTRPYIIVDFAFRDMLVYIAVRNIGTTPATNVRIKFDKPLTSPTDRVNPERFATFAEPIAMMAPGRDIRIYFGDGPDFFPTDGEPVPLRYEATVTYGNLNGTRAYKDPANILDLAPFKHASVRFDDLHQIAQQLKSITKELKGWTKRGRLRINSITQAEIDKEDEELWAEREATRASIAGSDASEGDLRS